MLYLGDFPTGQTIYIPFNTFSSDDPAASMTITGLAVTDIEIYKDGSATQRSSDSGYALLDTDGIDFDGITGIHGISIDTSDNTDAGFYAAGSDYWVVISSITLDAATVNFVAAIFSIDNRGLLRPTTAQRTLDVTATGAAGIDWGNVENKTTANDLSQTDIQLCDTTTTNTDMVGTDNAALASVCTEGRLAELDAANIPSDLDAVLVDTNSLNDTKIPNTLSLVNINAEVEDVIGTDANTELAAIPTTTSDLRKMVQFIFEYFRNKKTITSTTETLMKEDASTTLGTSTISDDGTTFTKSEMS